MVVVSSTAVVKDTDSTVLSTSSAGSMGSQTGAIIALGPSSKLMLTLEQYVVRAARYGSSVMDIIDPDSPHPLDMPPGVAVSAHPSLK
jgi:hypothetical protein